MPQLSTLIVFVTLVAIAGLLAAVIRLTMSRRRLAAELVSTRQLFAASMNIAPFCAYIKDSEGRYVYENPTLVTVTRKSLPHVTSFLGLTDLDVLPAAQARQLMDDDRKVLDQGRPLAFNNNSIDTDGTIRQWFSVKFPWIDEHGRACVGGISVDTSEVERAQATARASDARCSLALEAGRMGTVTLDLATQMLDTSALFATLHGRPETKTRLGVEESLTEVHVDDRPAILQAIHAALRDQPPNRITYRVVLPHGGIRWVELMGRVFTDRAGRPTVVHGVGYDITEQREAYEELARRKSILRRLIDVQENERQTLCHELHDGLIQYAIGAKMQLDSARDEDDAATRAERIEAAIDCLDRGIAEGRQVIRGVRPAVLDDLGLSAAIEDLGEQMAAAGVTVEMSLAAGLDDVPSHLCNTIYRVVQEALTNVRKHAGTDRATVEVLRVADDVHVRVRDRGPGCDVEEARARGFGLVGMTERVRLAGGTFWIESQPGVGTQVNARLPVASAGAGHADGTTSYAAAPGFDAR
jgi:PAS domain S-box-containing protein